MPLSPSATRDLLAQLAHRPKRFLGQNFLVDGNIVRKSLQLAEIRAGDTVVEIGPGLGTLTSALLEAGAEVWAVEMDRVLLDHLTATLGPKFGDRLHLMEGDAVEHPLAGYPLAHQPSPSLRPTGARGYKIIANLPYAISTPWMDAVLSQPVLPERMVLMLQKEAADRYCAVPGTKAFGAISIFLQAAYDVAPGHIVSSACFYPKPEVESRLLVLVRKQASHAFSEPARKFIRGVFQQRRKQLGSILRARTPELAAQVLAVVRSSGLTEKARPEQVPIETWVRIGTLLA